MKVSVDVVSNELWNGLKLPQTDIFRIIIINPGANKKT